MKSLMRILAAVFLLAGPAGSQTDLIAPGDNLVVEGIPPIPAALAEAVGRYTEFRSAALLDWHPSKREVLVRTRFGETPQVHRVEFPGGARSQLTFFPDRVGSAAYRPKTGDSFVFSKDRGGDEFYQYYRYDLATGGITLLTDGRSRNTGARWSTGGEWMAYGSTRRNGKDVDLWVVDPSDPATDHLLASLEGGGWEALDWSPDDRQILLLEEISINETYLWLVDAATGERTLLTPKGGEEKIAYLRGQFSKDGKGIYVTTDRDSEFQRLAYRDLASREPRYLTSHIPWDVEDFDLSPDGSAVAFATNEEGIGVLHLLETATGQERPAPSLPRGIVSNLKWHENGRDLGFNLISARTPADVFSLDIATGRVDRWTRSETGGLDPEGFSEPELIRWKSFDGRTISGFLYRPPARFPGSRPVVIDIHGGPEGQFRPGFLGRSNYFLDELGCALVFPNVRGSSGYGKTFLQLDNGLLREGSYADVRALLDWIGTQSDLDNDRIMVTGGSYGGFMTLAVATTYPERIRCAVDVVGPSNLVTFLQNTSEYRRDLRRAEYGDERDPKVRGFLERTAPLNNAAKIARPLFVVQGQNDPRVPASESEQMMATAKQQGTSVWYLLAKDEGHGFAKKRNADFQFYATVLFMQEHLLR